MTINSKTLAVTPETAGYLPERIKALDEFYISLIEKGELQGAIYGLSRNGCAFAERALGRRRHDDPEQGTLRHDSIRRIASITKLFTAVAILKLNEDGALNVAHPVCEYLKEFDGGPFRDINLAHLLTHTSGISGDDGALPALYRHSWYDMCCFNESTHDHWVKAAIAGPPRAKPGEIWSYSSIGYAMLGEIVTRITGIKYEDWVMDNITAPLGLSDTYFDVPRTKWDRVVAVDDWSDPFKREELAASRKDENARSNRRELDIPSAGGGLFSTVGDLLTFGNTLLHNGLCVNTGKRILSKKSVDMLRTDCGYESKNFCWGLKGVKKYYGHGADLYGYNRQGLNSRGTYGHEGAGFCGLYIDPDEGFVAAFFVPNTVGWHSIAVENGSNIIWSGLA